MPRDGQDTALARYESIVKRELESGVILYNPPPRMRVGVVDRVEVRIARGSQKDLSEGLKGKADPQVERLLVGTTMKARLEGREFDIVQIGSDVQELEAEGYREWRWDVTPKTSGNFSLFFVVSVLHEQDPYPIQEKVFERRVDVVVNPGYSVLGWLSENWEKAVATLVGTIGIIEGYRRLRSKPTKDRAA